VVVTTTEPTTGLTGSATLAFVVYEPLVSKLEVTTPECGLEVSWHATTNVGTTLNVYVEPFDKIVTDDLGYYSKADGTVRLTEAGTFDVFMYSDIFVPGLGSCVSSTTTYFTVKECPCNH
jgi:hypothetical protein